MAGGKRAPAAKAEAEAAAAEEAAPAGESPVISAVSKRLRNLRKKLKNVEALEALQRDNKELNPEQLSALAAKGAVKGAADELERLLASLPEALAEERTAAAAQARAAATTTVTTTPQAAPQPPPRAATPPPPPPPPPVGLSPAQAEELVSARIATLMEALYLSRLFDVTEEGRPTFGAQMERSAAISWDGYRASVNQARFAATFTHRCSLLTLLSAQDPLTHADLEAISQFGRVLTSRPPTSTLHHHEALRRCTALAQAWAARASTPVPELAMSLERLRDRCARILSSEYCTQVPVLQTCTADTARQTAAAAAAAGAAGAFTLPAQPSTALFPPDPLFAGGPPLWSGTQQFGDYDPRNM